MWLSALVLIWVVVQVMLQAPTVSPTKECRVLSSFNLSLMDNKLPNTTTWGLIKDAEAGAFLSVKFHKSKVPYMITKCSHTHVTTSNITSSLNEMVSSKAVSWPVCFEWRQFHLAVQHNILTITDDHNNTWVSQRLRNSTTSLEVTMDHFNSSCTTLTPMWEVRGGCPQDIVVPHCCDVLHFTLEAKKTAEPQLTVGNVNLPLGQLSPSRPRLSLTTKSTTGAAPRVVEAVVWGSVVEVGCTLSTFSLSSINNDDAFTLRQHLHFQECQPKTQDSEQSQTGLGRTFCCTDISLVFIWTAAVCSIGVHFFIRRFITHQPVDSTVMLAENNTAAVSSLWHPASQPQSTIFPLTCNDASEGIYDDIEDT